MYGACPACGGPRDECCCGEEARIIASRDAQIARLEARVGELEEALKPLADASRVSSAQPVYAIGVRFGAPYDAIAAGAMVERARAALRGDGKEDGDG